VFAGTFAGTFFPEFEMVEAISVRLFAKYHQPENTFVSCFRLRK
jgi:hypothetical protein